MPSGARVWIAMGHADMRKGMQGLALLVQQGLKGDPHGGDLFVFRGRAGALVKVIWHDGVGMSLYAKRLEKGRFVWPSAKGGMVSLTASQLACLLDGIAVFLASAERRIGRSFSSLSAHFALHSGRFL
ncbi:IS66 family insertion sequence element accessory protein TnpB [Novosphingobium sp. UBA1939]|uniref:IS66 family insertion sequence element accessory protein TnpB n=1 Tax=Novosphingobium sp. UBA1939 TaxID=1946982 RepID=UPI0032E3A4EA